MSWITFFKLVPWADVVQAAPAVAKGARQLWMRVRGEAAAPAAQAPAAGAGADAGPAAAAAPALAARLAQAEQRLEQLSSEALASSELIARLAQQNETLVGAVDVLRQRTRVLLRWCAVLTLASAGLAAALLLRAAT